MTPPHFRKIMLQFFWISCSKSSVKRSDICNINWKRTPPASPPLWNLFLKLPVLVNVSVPYMNFTVEHDTCVFNKHKYWVTWASMRPRHLMQENVVQDIVVPRNQCLLRLLQSPKIIFPSASPLKIVSIFSAATFQRESQLINKSYSNDGASSIAILAVSSNQDIRIYKNDIKINDIGFHCWTQ